MTSLLAEVLGGATSRTTAWREADNVALGGIWSQPYYTGTYLQATKLLVEKSHRAQQLELVAVPVLYLQRHALELVLKDLLAVMFDIYDNAKYLEAVTSTAPRVQPPSEDERRRSQHAHDLASLLSDAHRTHARYCAAGYDLRPISPKLDSIVAEFVALERKDPSRFRYSTVGLRGKSANKLASGKPPKVQGRSFDSEVVEEIVRLQAALESLVEELQRPENSLFFDLYVEARPQWQRIGGPELGASIKT